MSIGLDLVRLKRLAAKTMKRDGEPRRSRARSALIESLEPRQLLSAATQWTSEGPGGGGAFFSPSFSPFNSSELFASSDMSGLYHTTNLGQSWTVADFRQIQAGIASQVQFTSDPNILYTLDYSDTSDGSSSTAPTESTDGGKTWKQVAGWNGANDQAFSLFADPQNTTSLVVTDYGNLYFSGNGGQSFTKVYTDPNSGQGCYVGGVFWDGSNVYVGTDSGLIVSSNGGASFASANVSGLPAGSSILSLAGAKQNGVVRLVCITASSGDVFNGLETGSIPQGSYSGIWTVTPGQSSWTKAATVPADDGPLLVSMATNDTSDIYVGGTDYNTSDPIVAKSTDGGHTFADVLNVVNNGNVATGWQGAGGDHQWSFDQLTEGFDVSPTNANDIAFTGFGYLHLSTDGGQTWRQAYVNPADQNPAGAATPQGKAYQGVGLEDTSTLYLDWADQQTILAGYTDINGVRSTDGGQSWSFPAGITLAGNTVYCVTQQGSTFYAATSNTHDIYQSTHVTDASLDGGNGNILYSTDAGATWQVMHNFSHPVIWVATDPTDANRMYASVISSTAGGIYTTDNLSAGVNATWTKVTAPPRTQGHPFNIDVLNDGTMVTTFSARRVGSSFTDSSGVFISTDHGQTWSDRTGAGMHWWTKDITIDPTDPTQSTWYASVRFAYGTSGANGTGGLYRTTDRGQSWTQIFQSIGAESAAINPNTGELYVSTEENGLYYSANPAAATPTFTQTDYPFRQPERIFFNPFNSNEVWVTSFGYGLAVGTIPAVTGSTASTTTLVPSSASIHVGDTVTFTATVADATTGGATPTGTVVFIANGQTLATLPLQSDGTATYSTSALSANTFSINASYSGDNTYAASSSSPLTETVAAGATASTTMLVSSAPIINSGDTVTFTATVANAIAGGAMPTGTVEFIVDGVTLATLAVASDGTATYTTSTLTAETHSLSALYSGDSTYAQSTSAIVMETVNRVALPSSLVPTLGRVVLPAGGVSGSAFKAKAAVVLTNTTGNMKGTVTLHLLLNTAATLAGNPVVIATLTAKNLSLGAGKHRSFNLNVKSLPAGLAPGTYYLLAEVVDPAGATNQVAASQTTQVAAPFVRLATTIGPTSPANIKNGKAGAVSVTIANQGNVDAAGAIQLTLSPSLDGTTPLPGMTLAAVMRNRKIKAGKSAVYRLRFKVTNLPPGTYFPFVSVALGDISTTGVGTMFTVE